MKCEQWHRCEWLQENDVQRYGRHRRAEGKTSAGRIWWCDDTGRAVRLCPE